MSVDNTQDAVDTATTVTPDAAFADEVATQGQFTADDIAKARQQEKAKVYDTIQNLREELTSLRKREDERAAIEADKAAKRAEREAQRAAERKSQAEEEMSVKELLKNKESEWQKQLDSERAEREKAFALLQLEKEYNELQSYRQSRLAQEQENIVPELIDLVAGNSKDEIESSIADLKARSNKIFESVAQVNQQARKEMVGSRVTMPASGPLDTDSDSSSYTPGDISSMSMADYAKNRAKLLGTASNNRGQGLFGN